MIAGATNMAAHFADRLLAEIERKKTPAVVALDPVFENLPRGLRDAADPLRAIRSYAMRVLELVAPHVPCVKINSAYFEAYHAPGIAVFDELLATARRLGLITLADVKRGDVGHTATMYALAQLGDGDRRSDNSPDAVTVSGYFGEDGVRPFIAWAAPRGQGVFVLVRTSNPSATVIQDAPLANGQRLHEWVGRQVASWAAEPETLGERGYSLVGAVAATRDAGDARRLREAMPHSIVLVPGYGAQGGRAEDFAPYFKPDGTGALIVSGRSVIFAYEKAEATSRSIDWEQAVAAACKSFADDVARLITRN
jgi:orotidine-5'-phosphate decarboxylase